MVKLNHINYIMGGVIILMAVISLRETYSDLQNYGWVYTQNTTIGEEVTESVVSVSTGLFATIFLAILGGLFLVNGSVAGRSLILDVKPLEEGEETGIIFPKGVPEDWDLGVDLRTRVINVTLNDFTMSFPLTKILGWVEKHEKEKMDEMQ